MRSFVRPEIGSGVRCPLVAACAAGLLTLGLAAGVWAGTVPGGVIGGQGGATAGNSLGGAAGNGGQSGSEGAAGGIGSAGNGGAGGASSQPGGSGGTFGLHATVNSSITGATGSAGGGGSYWKFNSGSGGGGGGDGVYADAGVTITNPASSTIAAGNGGAGGNGGYNYIGMSAFYYGGSGGGGGNGVEFAGSGTLVNQGVINGGTGGSAGASNSLGAYTSAPSGSGGGHGVVGADITITNSGTIAAGAAGSIQTQYRTAYGTAGDAILFTGGSNTLKLITGSTISGNLELATGTSASIAPQNSGLTLSSKVVLDAGTSLLDFNTTSAPLTVSGIISGAGSLSEGGSSANPLILTAANIFTGGSAINSGLLQVDGSIGNVTIAGGVLDGIGSVGNITANGGSVSPGEASAMFGTLNSSGTANLAAGSTLAIRGTDGVTCSALHAIGALTLAGSLSIHFENAPKVGAVCTIATGSSVSGTFASVASAPATVTVTYPTGSVQINVTASDDIFADGFDGGAR